VTLLERRLCRDERAFGSSRTGYEPAQGRLKMAAKIHLLAVLFLAIAAVSHAAGPENAHQVDATGWWECDRGYVMQSRPGGCVCVPESEISREQVIMSRVPSAGGGSLPTSGSSRAARETAASAPSSSRSLFIQTNEPWTVVLDTRRGTRLR
jgi:hypothetical protein